MSDHAKGLLITLFGVLFVVPDALFVRLVDADPLVRAFWRVTLSGAGMLLGVLVLQGAAPVRAALQTGWVAAVYAFGLGASGVMFVLAVSLTSVANVVFIIAALPVFAALFSWLLLGEIPSARMILTTLAVGAGIGILTQGSGETHGANWRGDLLALGVAALFALALTVARKARAVSMVPVAATGYLAAGLAVLPFIDPWAVAQWPPVFWHAAFIIGSTTLLAIGPRFTSSAEMGLLILLETVLAPLLVWAVLGENPGIWALMGGAVVICALAASNAAVLLRKS